MPYVPVVMLVAAAAVLAGVIVVALGRGGELAFFPADYAPVKLDEVAATDVVLFRPPLALWGYNAQATDEALNRIAEALTERDIEITALRQQVANLKAASAPGRRPYGPGPRPRDEPGGRPVPRPRDARPPQDGEQPPFRPGEERAARRPSPGAPDEDRFGLGGAAAAGQPAPGGPPRAGPPRAGPPRGEPPPGHPPAGQVPDLPRAQAGEEDGR